VPVMVKEKPFPAGPLTFPNKPVMPYKDLQITDEELHELGLQTPESASNEPHLRAGHLWICKQKSLSPGEIIAVAAQIGRGEDKSTIVRAMPGYAEREHKSFALAYDLIREQSGLLDDRVVQVRERRRSAAMSN
jgi:hypothetical protein